MRAFWLRPLILAVFLWTSFRLLENRQSLCSSLRNTRPSFVADIV